MTSDTNEQTRIIAIAIQNGFEIKKIPCGTSSEVKLKKQNKNIENSNIKIGGFKKYKKYNKKRKMNWL